MVRVEQPPPDASAVAPPDPRRADPEEAAPAVTDPSGAAPPSELGASEAPPADRPWRRSLRQCLVVYACVRLALFLLGLLTVALIPAQQGVGVPGWPARIPSEGWHSAFTAWERADALWFLRIASTGYDQGDGSPAFFPMFPMLVHGVGVLTGGRWLLAGFLVSNAALLIALVVLHRLTDEAYGDRTANRTVLYLCLFPTAFFLFSPFSEPVFLAFAVGALYAARHRAWPLAGTLGAGAALTRSVGIALCAVLLVEAVHQHLEDRRAGQAPLARLLGRLAACAVPALGTAAYLGYWQLRAGDWQVPLDAQAAGWDRQPSFPLETLRKAAVVGTDYLGVYPGGYFTLDLLLVVLAFGAAAWLTVRARPLYAVYAWLSLVFPLLLVFEGRPLMSVPRFLLVVFPLFWALARFAERWRAHDLVVGISAAGLSLVGALAVSWLPIF